MNDSRIDSVLSDVDLYIQGSQKRCSVTGQKIGGENYIKISDAFIFSKEGIEKIIKSDYLEKKGHDNSTYSWTAEDRCAICHQLKKCNLINKKEDITKQKEICNDCLFICKKMCEGEKPVHHQDDYFMILEIPKHGKKFDSLSGGKKTDSNYIIRLASSEKIGISIQTKLENIEKLIKTLKYEEKGNSFISESQDRCCLCGDMKNNLMITFVAGICKKCREKAAENLEEYLSENKKDVLSRII